MAALLLVVLVAGTIGAPSITSWAKGEPAPRGWAYRAPSAAQLTAIDPGIATGSGIPRSGEPAGGILFVRCTRLWSALPDGTHARPILAMTGISSPTFSPDGRSIAFFAPADGALAIWMAGADGSDPRVIAPLTVDGEPIAARAMNLTWSPYLARPRLVFALSDPRFDPYSGGSAIWSFDITTGEFTKHASGGVVPFWIDRRIAYSKWSRADGPTLWTVGRAGSHQRQGRMNGRGMAELTGFVVNSPFYDAEFARREALVLRERPDGTRVLALKRSQWANGVRAEYEAPRGYGFSSMSRVSLAQDGSRAIVDLRDRDDGRALGLLDLRSGKWTVIGYAWDGTATPVATASGPLNARRVSRLASNYLGLLRPRDSAAFALLAHDPDDADLIPWRKVGEAVGTPTKRDGTWHVPATVLMKKNRLDYAYRHLDISLRATNDGRITADAWPRSDVVPLATLQDVQALVADVIGERFAWPDLPAGAQLAEGYPLSMYSTYDGTGSTVSVQFTLPSTTGRPDDLSIAFGEVGFGLGCGGEVSPEDGQLDGTPAVFDSVSEGTRWERNQVVWPATVQDRSAVFYSVYGSLDRDEIARIAASMTS